MHRSLLLLLVFLAGCTAGRAGPGGSPPLVVDVVSDLRPGVDVASVEAAVFRDADLELTTVTTSRSLAGASLSSGLRVLDTVVDPAGPVWVRVRLLDAAGRVRAERVAALDATRPRAVALGLAAADAPRVCPGDEDPDDAVAAVGGTCAPETCVDAASCPVEAVCAADVDCGTDDPCRRAACVRGACLALDACGDGEVCGPDGCVPAPRCGDGACDTGVETACGCPDDCGPCPAGCGDGACDAGEACPEDCGAPEARCGDAVCEVDAESVASCPLDCARERPPLCGDPVCEGEESCERCPECCEARGCGDGACDPLDEDASTCPSDCGAVTACGDGRCEPGEDCASDCEGAALCGDGVCDETESCARCEVDCGWCVGVPVAAPGCDLLTAPAPALTCAGVGGAFPTEAVHVAYYPMRVVAFAGTELTTGARTVATLPEGARFAVRSTRNATCAEAPPIAPARDGMLLGYAPDLGEDGWGWVAADDLALEDDERASCLYGPRGDGFAVRLSPYAASGCGPLACAAEDVLRSCAMASRVAPEDCAGRIVAREGAVGVEVARLRLSPDGPVAGFLHAGDRLRVLYESGRPGWIFVEALESAAPELAPAGTRGWMNATEVDG